MKRNTIIKVMSASILAASLTVVDFPTNLQQTKYVHAVGTQEVSVDVAAHLLNANNSGQRSMGDAALEKVSIKKVGNQYQYTIIWKDLNFNGQSDGISKFWVEGKEVQLSSTTYPNVSNPKQAVFTLPELKSTLNVEVFVQIMENIMPGAGRKSAILQLDTNGVAEQLETSTTEKQSTTTDNSAQENKTTKQAETDNSAKEDANQNSAAKAAKEKAEAERLAKEKAVKEKAKADRTAKENTTNNTSNVNNSTSSTHYSGFRSANRNTANRTSDTNSNPVSSSPQGTTRSVSSGNSTRSSGTVTSPTPAQPNNSSQTSPAQSGNQDEEVTFFDDVSVSLFNASNPGELSMGHKALDGITVYKDSKNTYHYIVKFQNITVGQSSDGISRFWVNGTEYPVTSTGGANNQVEVHFTSSEKLQQVPVSVFVQTMENIMPGAGKKDAILSLDWSRAKERKGTAPKDPNGGPANKATGNNTGNNTGNTTSGRINNSGNLSKTGLENTYTVLIGAAVLVGVVLIITRRKQN